MIKLIREGFKSIGDHRKYNFTYLLQDLLSAGFAVFMLKDPSLLAFRHQFPCWSENLKRIYGIEQIPEDPTLRQALDGIEPSDLPRQFKPSVDTIRQGGVVEQRLALCEYTVLVVDGTLHFCSGKQSCPQCLTKKYRNGSVTYHHQMLGAVWAHTGEKTVYPVAVEPIVPQDGKVKNACELYASKRPVPQIRQVIPNEKLLLTMDALYANASLIRLLSNVS